MTGRAHRLEPIVAALAGAERMRLAAHLAQIERLTTRAAERRAAARAAPPGTDGPDMAITASWQAAAEDDARAALAEAMALNRETPGLRNRLARALGRESAVASLISDEKRQSAIAVSRRMDDQTFSPGSVRPGTAEPAVQSSEAGLPGTSSVGTT